MKNKIFGFTLAEVLITLGVIGVVAALTLPTLIQNYQRKALLNQLKKSYTTLQNGCRMILATEGADNLGDLGWDNFDQNGKDAFIKKYFKNISVKTNDMLHRATYYTRSSSHPVQSLYNSGAASENSYKLGDSSEFNISYFDSNTFAGYIDVNGPEKKPNKIGEDLFYFQFSGNCRTIIAEEYWCESNEATMQSWHVPTGCLSKIIKEGWTMNYSANTSGVGHGH